MHVRVRVRVRVREARAALTGLNGERAAGSVVVRLEILLEQV